MPVVEIDIKTLNVLHSWIIDAYRLDFMLIFWTDDLKNAAIEDIENLYRQLGEDTEKEEQLTMNQIQVYHPYFCCFFLFYRKLYTCVVIIDLQESHESQK